VKILNTESGQDISYQNDKSNIASIAPATGIGLERHQQGKDYNYNADRF
jgi:hypothetical protein